jgi:hypothetical protein
MDQLKDLLKQCVKYRFWIAFGISLLLPMIGYFVGVGGIVQAKTNAEQAINSAKTEVGKYTAGGIVNGQYQPEAAKKNSLLTKDVDESWRKLRTLQEPLLRWPEEVEARFLHWGRKFPSDVDRGEVTRTLVDYTFSYPNFVSKIYKIFKPFNYEDGTGIVVAPDEKTLLKPVAFSSDYPPELSKVWAEQERIWVVTALLDAVAKINETVNAKTWDEAIVKQINLVDVGAYLDQDQKSVAEGVALVPADALLPEGAPAPPPVAPAGGPGGGAPGASPGASPGGNSQAATNEVYYLKNDSKQYKTLPIKMTVLVDQSKLADFLVGLENSPITIQVLEAEVARPSSPVTKPEMGENSSNGNGGPRGSMRMMPGEMARGGPGYGGRAPGGAPGIAASGAARGGPGGAPGSYGRGGTANAPPKGEDARGTNKQLERKNANKEASKTKGEQKPKADQYYNIVEVTVYGQARFYLAPPPLPVSQPSTSAPAPAPAPEAAKNEPAKPATPTPADAKQADEPKPVDAPKSDEAAKKDEAPKAEMPGPKADEPKPDASKPDPAKGNASVPKS